MAAKTIQISKDEFNWFTLPGNTGDFNAENEQLDDTIFGVRFASTQPGLTDWSVSANAMYRGFAGYVASIKRNGTSTEMGAPEAMQAEGNNVYKIVDETKEIWDRSSSVEFSDDNGSIASSNIKEIDYLFGRVTFVDSFSPSGDVTVEASFFSYDTLGCSNSFSLTQTADTTNTTCFETAAVNGGFNSYHPTLKTVELELSGFYRSENNFYELLKSRDELIVEINPDGQGKSVARGFFKPVTDSQTGDVGGDETETISFGLSTPDGILPFGWEHASDSTIPEAVKILIDAWAANESVYVRYLPNGPQNEGREGEVIVTDISLEQSVDGMAEFSVELQGTSTADIINVSS